MDSTALDDSCDVLEGQNADKGGGVATNTAGSNNKNNNNSNNNNKARLVGIDRTQKIGILVCVVLTVVVGVVIAIVILLPSNDNDNDNNNGNNNNNLNLNSQATTNTSAAPSTVPTLSPEPSFAPSTSPTMAPTVPELGCRGDRFDNEGNQEKNNRLFAGQFICSDDADQRYRFGIDPATGNLMTLDVYTNQIRTYYHNDYHKQQQQKQQQQLERRLDALSKTNNTSSINETQAVNDDGDGDCNEWIPPEEEIGDTESESVSVSKSSHHPNCTERQAETTTKDTQSPTSAPTSTTYLDYYFSVSTQAAFRIHRVSRTEDYEIVDQVLHWELPTTYNISLVYQNCLKTHDCPYLHLHQDGVIVLAWLDFRLNSYDGWMEKNIRRCYEFNTTDQL